MRAKDQLSNGVCYLMEFRVFRELLAPGYYEVSYLADDS